MFTKFILLTPRFAQAPKKRFPAFENSERKTERSLYVGNGAKTSGINFSPIFYCQNICRIRRALTIKKSEGLLSIISRSLTRKNFAGAHSISDLSAFISVKYLFLIHEYHHNSSEKPKNRGISYIYTFHFLNNL